jgi:fructose-specific phosphotransferase system IIC component
LLAVVLAAVAVTVVAAAVPVVIERFLQKLLKSLHQLLTLLQ